MSMERPLALRCPLRGSRLIEASAGTGKTFTISALYLRLVIGHGGVDGFVRPLLPPEILVVTFTDAATQELRDRIRARLVQAAKAFRGELEDPDPILSGLLQDMDPEQHAACAHRLEIAGQWMDQAAVSTIHSWCQRMLREHAFDSGSLFEQTLETDQSELLAEVVRDYWRTHCYPLQDSALDWVNSHWGHPDELARRVRVWLDTAGSPVEQDLQALLASRLEQAQEQLAQIREPWADWLDELQTFLAQACEAGSFNGNKLKPTIYEPRIQQLRAWCEGRGTLDFKKGEQFKRFTHEGLQDACRKGVQLELPAGVCAALDAMATLEQRLAQLPDPAQDALEHAAWWIGRRLEQEKQRRAQMGFDDMLSRLDTALQGANGPRLADVIRQQFPVAMIDEFQDTDPLQYRIFDSIYRVGLNDPDSALLLIGDPKQAIYSFRGADIHTYLRARDATHDRHENLDTNFRSSQQMVSAVNGVFRLAEEQWSEGAFRFRDGHGNPLPFLPVHARGRREIWTCEGRPGAALTVWHRSGERVSSEDYRQDMAQRCASVMVALLRGGQAGHTGFMDAEQRLVPVRPADMAVLVRTGREAQIIRQALAERGVRSVYLSDKDSVLATQEAADVLRWLRACAEPGNDRLLRAALASATLALSWTELEQLNQDERRWERWVEQFREYRQCWMRQGVLPMLHRLLHEFRLPARLVQRGDGERRLTNLLHLAELLQQAARELDGEQALIRYLSEAIQRALDGAGGDEQILRLESDADLVKVVTIHKSKGLEYPLVFLPFIAGSRPVRAGEPVRLQQGGRSRWVLEPDSEQLQQADRERMGEDLRLLYVALTRAQHACWLGLSDLRRGRARDSVLHESAIAWLLGGGEQLQEPEGLARWLAAWQQLDGINVVAAPEPDDQHYQPVQSEQVELHERTPAHAPFEHWWISSYSALAIGGETPDSPLSAQMGDDERRAQFLPLRAGETPSIHRFPRGPQPGTFLHGLLELAGAEGFERFADPQLCQERLRPRCQRRGWGDWSECLADWLSALIARPGLVPGTALALADLRPGQYQVEMEFLFSAQRVKVQQVDELVRRATLAGQPRAALVADRLNGLFKGFIDLVFEHEGRYYVVDYKSNWLGVDASAYTQDAMTTAVLEHRYDLQYVFYLLALHRQLRARLPDYDYDRHVGGALYWFIRGSGGQGTGLWHDRPPRALIEALDRLFAGQAQGRCNHDAQ